MSILTANLPEDLHERLESAARRAGKTVSDELVEILNRALPATRPPAPFRPVEPTRPFTHEWLLDAIREGRE